MNYPANSMCLWIIRSPEGKTIKLTFTDFDLEEAGILLGRCYDNVVIYDGTQPGAKKYGKGGREPCLWGFLPNQTVTCLQPPEVVFVYNLLCSRVR